MLSISAITHVQSPRQLTARLVSGCCLLLLVLLGLEWLRYAHPTGRAGLGRCKRHLHVNASLEPRPRDDIPGWNACHAQRAASMAAADEGLGPPLILYGDSITERWLGTSQCAPLPPAQGVPAVFARHFARFNASVMGIAADTTAHLMWRLTHGEAPVKHNPAVAVVLIGTNDLGYAWMLADPETAEEAVMCAVPGVKLRVQRTLEMLRGMMPATHIVLLALLPRGPGAELFGWPSAFTGPIDAINLAFREFTRPDDHLHFLDCGHLFLTPDQAAINRHLMPDTLHPSTAGYGALARCILPRINQLMRATLPPVVPK
ncbi:Platelet-activating factor acetylhydrolase IB subunit gamma [Chlorella vulgaris]